MKPKMVAGVVLIVIGAISLLAGGIRSATAGKPAVSGAGQTVQSDARLATVRGVLTAVCLLGGTGLVIASVVKK
jgi:hypothetical protein